MNRRKWLWAALLAVPVAVGGGLAYASGSQKAKAYTCPVTGEELPCERCCPLNADKPGAATTDVGDGKPKSGTGENDYTCMLTGEKLGCPNCCPLNEANR